MNFAAIRDSVLAKWDSPPQVRAVYEKTAREEGFSKSFENAKKEYVEFCLAKMISEDLSPSLEVDTVWHTHLLYTKDYRKFEATVRREFAAGLPEHIDYNMDGAEDGGRSQRLGRAAKLLEIMRLKKDEMVSRATGVGNNVTSGLYQIAVKTMDNKNYYFMVHKGWTVGELKNAILSQTGISPDRQRLTFSGKMLSINESLLGDLGIHRDVTIIMLSILRGC